MTLEQVKRLKRGATYTLTAQEEKISNGELYEKTYTAEYRGLAEDYGYLLFWIEGDSKAREFMYTEILNIKEGK